MSQSPTELSIILPSYASLGNQKLVVPSSKKPFVAVDEHFLQKLMEPLLARITVDEPWYLKQYPDVEAAILKGLVPDARTHYVRYGYYEHRLPYAIQVNESWYLTEYPDIQQAVDSKAFTSGQHHYETVGFREGRFPYPGFEFQTGMPRSFAAAV